MTTVEVLFRYNMPPGEAEMSALGQMSDVYGIRRVRFDEQGRTIRVEYDATRLNESAGRKTPAQCRLRRPRTPRSGLGGFAA